MNKAFGTILDFDHEGPITPDELDEVKAFACVVHIGDDKFLEIKTRGPVDEPFSSEPLQVIRISEAALKKLNHTMDFFS